MQLRRLATLVPLVFAALTAHADTFRYDVEFNNNNGLSSSATFTVPSILTTDATVAATGSSSFEGSVDSVEFYEAGQEPCGDYNIVACLTTNLQYGTTNLSFATAPDAAGTYYANAGLGRVTITDVPDISAVTPEPASLVLLGTGLLGVGGALRRRFA